MRVKQKRKSTIAANRTIALITMAMMLASIFSVTAFAISDDAVYVPEMETVDGYITNDLESNADVVLGGEEILELEASEPNASAFDEDVEIHDDNTYNHEEDLLYGDESANNYEYYVKIEALADFVVTNWDGLYDVFTNLMTTAGPYTVDVVSSITMEAQLNIPIGRTVYLTGGVLYQPTANARHFTVDGILVLNGIVLRGTGIATYRGGITVNASGELIMSAESAIEGNTAVFGAGVENRGTIIMNGGIISQNSASHSGGGVTGGTLIMNNGEISDNYAHLLGGGVSSGFITMNGGSIHNNYTNLFGGGIFVSGELVMNGGSIISNRANTLQGGGGVSVRFGTFTMYGGVINDNFSSEGGGIAVYNYSSFIMYNGEISNNIGGGIGNSAHGEVIMYNGVISDNVSRGTLGGGGVINSGAFTMNGGTISRNIATDNRDVASYFAHGGGGVRNSGTFTMNSGTISNNTATGINIQSGMGGGVFNTNSFTMNGGTIYGNIAQRNGGGVFIWRGTPPHTAMFTMTDGAIMNNAAAIGDGGGIFSMVHEDYQNPLAPTAFSNITFESGTICGNTAGNGRYALPMNYYERTFGHLMNNYDINFRGSHRVEIVTFDLNDGNVDGSPDDVEVILAYNTQIGITNIPTPERLKYNFTGWLLGDELLTSVEVGEIVVDAPMTFEAQWEAIVQIIPNPEYRSIRIYYYVLEDDVLVRDIENNPFGRQYSGRVGDTFDLGFIGVLDRNTLDSDNYYVFEGWRVYVDGAYNYTYILDKDMNNRLGSFIVSGIANAASLSFDEDFATFNDNIVGGTIRLLAVWSVYEVQESGSDDDYNQQKLPRTGIESNILLWSAFLTLVLSVGFGVVVKIRGYKDN